MAPQARLAPSRFTSRAPARRASRTWRSRISRRLTPAEQTSSRFRAQRFEDFYLGWSAAAGDFNHDGVLDVTIGNRYYLAAELHRIARGLRGQPYNPAKDYSPAMVNYAFDYTGDGWDDILVVESRTPVLYNPKVAAMDPLYAVFTTPVTSESIVFKDINGDGKPDATYGAANGVHWVSVDPANPTGSWKTYTSRSRVSRRAFMGSARATSTATARSTSSRRTGGGSSRRRVRRRRHGRSTKGAFGRNGNAGGNIEVYDVNGDKLPDIVTALAAHGFGLAW